MKWLDDILSGPTEPGPTTPPPPPRVRVAQNEGTVAAPDATPIGELLVKNVDPATFNVRYRLVINPEMWEHVEVVCGGNAAEVDIEPISEDRYRVKTKVAGYVPAWKDEEHELELPTFESTKEFINWIESLDTTSIEALRQIYYDRWTFDTGNQRDRMFYELLEEEKKGRKK